MKDPRARAGDDPWRDRYP